MTRQMDQINKANNDHDDHDDHDDAEVEFQSRLWTLSVWVAAIPLMYYGYYKAALCFITVGFMYLFQSYLVRRKVPLVDQYKIKYDVYTPDDVIKDIYSLHQKVYLNQLEGSTGDVTSENIGPASFREISVIALSALAKKYNQIPERQKRQTQQQPTLSVDAMREINQKYCDFLQHLAVQYQDLIHAILFVEQPRTTHANSASTTNDVSAGGDDDELISATLALLALISKQSVVRLRYHRIQVVESSTATKLSLDFEQILHCINAALLRAKNYGKNSKDDDGETKDHIAAELQRKACLFIGAISDGSDRSSSDNDDQPKQSLSIQIGQQGGIQTILNALSWYQYHVEVVNWGLWALFVMCYENTSNQVIFIQLNGIPIMIQSMRNCFDTDENDTKSVVDVARHGPAILFDLLREQADSTSTMVKGIDRWKVRNIALSAGLHECIVQAMTISIAHLKDNMDIFVMGREILVGTNYQGSIPEPPMTLIPSSS